MRKIVVVGLIGGAVVVAAVVVARRRAAIVEAPAVTQDRAPLRLAVATKWVEPDEQGSCPGSHPVKVKLASGIYHLPGGRYYPTTKADRCYCDEEAAEADGHRAAKR